MTTNRKATRDPLAWLRAAKAARDATGLGRRLTVRSPGPDGPLDLASNDYLGLHDDKRVIDGAIAAAAAWGAGATGSRLVTGSTAVHARLERELAQFTGAAAALVFSSGYLANLAAVTTLARMLPDGDPSVSKREATQTLIVSDAANHASLVDACRLSRARVVVTPHRDLAAVEWALAQRTEPVALVVTETVFSVTGDVADVAALYEATRAHRAVLVLDEAHALGVLGPGGRGVAYAAGIAGEPDVVRTMTLSKALASQGGAVVGAPEVIETLIDTGRAFIFDTALAPPCAGAAAAALGVLRDEPDRGRQAQQTARRLARLAVDVGFDVEPPAAAVVRLPLGEPEAALRAQRVCRDHGVWVGCFRPPSVPPGHSCLRMTGRVGLTEDDFTTVRRALLAARDVAG